LVNALGKDESLQQRLLISFARDLLFREGASELSQHFPFSAFRSREGAVIASPATYEPLAFGTGRDTSSVPVAFRTRCLSTLSSLLHTFVELTVAQYTFTSGFVGEVRRPGTGRLLRRSQARGRGLLSPRSTKYSRRSSHDGFLRTGVRSADGGCYERVVAGDGAGASSAVSGHEGSAAEGSGEEGRTGRGGAAGENGYAGVYGLDTTFSVANEDGFGLFIATHAAYRRIDATRNAERYPAICLASPEDLLNRLAIILNYHTP
jgi:hypothetical protein